MGGMKAGGEAACSCQAHIWKTKNNEGLLSPFFYFTAEPQPKERNYTQLGRDVTIHRHAQIFVSMVSLNFIKMTMKMNCH